MDVLSDVLMALRTGRPSASRGISHAPWGVRFPPGDAAGAHVVLAGGCWLLPAKGDPFPLGVGDVVFTPHGDGHALADQPDRELVDYLPVPSESSPVREMHIAGTGSRTELLCAAYTFDPARPHPMLDDLPRVIHLPARMDWHPSLSSAVTLLGDELREPRAGTDAAVPALIDMLLLYVLRAWLDEQTSDIGWAGALHDPAISSALRAIHRHPEIPWTVAALARKAGLSRAAFARRFTSTLRQPPLTYLTWWRMTSAARLLRESDAPLRTVAARCGYGSEFAFAKAFKREYGIAPGRYRRTT